MLHIACRGTPYEIGQKHGSFAAEQITGSINFYKKCFKEYTGNDWSSVLQYAEEFAKHIQQAWPRYHEEMMGVSQGSGRDFLDIVALNVRTEIAFGLLELGGAVLSDGCTSLSWQTRDHSFLGQNWDWMEEQRHNLIVLTIEQESIPAVKMVTEAGIIGKIGLNSDRVGVCLNAIRCTGFDPERLPVHLGLRMALESKSAADAAAKLERIGLASSAHLLLADPKESMALEFTSRSCQRLETSMPGIFMHTNHLIASHIHATELPEEDSRSRLRRIENNVQEYRAEGANISREQFLSFFDDHDGFPESICRKQQEPSKDETLFTIVMDLVAPIAFISVGRPCRVMEKFTLAF